MIADPDAAQNGNTSPADSTDPGDEGRFRGRLWFLFLLPLAGLAVGVVIAGILVWQKAPTYVSTGALWQTDSMRLPQGSKLAGVGVDQAPALGELASSEMIKDLAVMQLRTNSSSNIPLGPDGEPLPVKLTLADPTSAVCQLQAEAADPAYVQAYLDAVMNACIEHLRTRKQPLRTRNVTSDGSLAPLTEQVQRTELDLKNEQIKLAEFQGSNNLPLLQARSAAAAEGLRHLTVRLAELEVERVAAEPDTIAAQSLQTKITSAKDQIQSLEHQLKEFQDAARKEDELKLNIQRYQSLYDRLAIMVNRVEMSRDLPTEPAITQRATTAERTYEPEKRVLKRAGVIGLEGGLAIALLIVGNRAIRRLAPRAQGNYL